MNRANIYSAIALTGAISLLAGCDGNESTDPKNNQLAATSSITTAASSSKANTLEDCSLAPGAPACYIIKDSECLLENCAPDYRVMDACGVSKLPKNLEASMIKGGASDCGPESTSSSSSSAAAIGACETLDGRTYFTTTVEESGRGINGVAMHHWSISFKDGELNLRQSDFGLIGTYSCQGEQVIATVNHGTTLKETTLAFNQDFSGLSFNPFGAKENFTYNYMKLTETAITACEDVKGHTYTNAASIADTKMATLKGGDTFITFNDDGNTAVLGYSDIREAGHYECDLGTLHLHLNGKNANPTSIDVDAKGLTITLQDKNQTVLTRKKEPNEEEPVFCTQQYDPVCAAFDTGLRCITTPCDTFVYKTYGNACTAGAAKSEVLFKGECGDKEGKPVQEDRIVCPANYAPVCAKAKANIACIKAPCPSHEYKTFSNTCVATAAKAMVSFFSSCDRLKLENQVSFEQQPVRLYTPASSSIMQIQPSSKGIKIIDAAIKEDILTVTLGYSGCSKQAIYYNVDSSILSKSLPAQVSYSFSKEKEDLCDAYFESTYQYDLLPLRANFRNQVEGQYGLGILGASTIYKR